MPSSYTTNLRLELQATGENATTWGTRNNQVYSMIEAALSGHASIAIPNANHVLTAVNGGPDQARNMMLTFTGTLTAVRTVTIPTVPKVYIIRNATTGGFALTISNGTNTLSVPNGAALLVWTDGTAIRSSMNLLESFATSAALANLSGVSDKATARTNIGANDATNLTTGTIPAGRIEDASHGKLGGGDLHANATTSVAGFLSAADKTKLDGIQAGAQVNPPAATPSAAGLMSAADKAKLNGIDTAADKIPVGSMFDYAGSAAPSGWLLCAGQAVSRTTYADLFDVIGTTYGAGNGSSTFNVPDFRGRVAAGKDDMNGSDAGRLNFFGAVAKTLGGVLGAASHVLTTGEMPKHNHGGSTNSTGNHTHVLNPGRRQHGQHGLGGTNPNTGWADGDVVSSSGNHDKSTSSAGAHAHTIAQDGNGEAHANAQPTLIVTKIIKV